MVQRPAARVAEQRVRMNIRLVQARDSVTAVVEGIRRTSAATSSISRRISPARSPPPSKIADTTRRAAGTQPHRRIRRLPGFPARQGGGAHERGAKALADAAVFLEKVVDARAGISRLPPRCWPMIFALTPLFAPSLRPAATRRRSARSWSARSPAAIALRPPRHAARSEKRRMDSWRSATPNMVQRKMVAAEDAFRQALTLNPNQADGLARL